MKACPKCKSEIVPKGKQRKRGDYRCNACLRADAAAYRIKYPEYYSWASMVQRCESRTHKSYPRYGARGIRVCTRWRESFHRFREDMGPRPHGTTLDRIDNDGNYEPGNCRWALPLQQAANTPRSRLFEVDGVVLTVSEWARRTGIPKKRLHWRLNHGWAPSEAIATGRRRRPRF